MRKLSTNRGLKGQLLIAQGRVATQRGDTSPWVPRWGTLPPRRGSCIDTGQRPGSLAVCRRCLISPWQVAGLRGVAPILCSCPYRARLVLRGEPRVTPPLRDGSALGYGQLPRWGAVCGHCRCIFHQVSPYFARPVCRCYCSAFSSKPKSHATTLAGNSRSVLL